MTITEVRVVPTFSTQALLFDEDDLVPDHTEGIPGLDKAAIDQTGGWLVSMFNGVSSRLVAINLEDQSQAELVATAKVRYQEKLVTDEVFTGTDSVLIQSPEGEVTVHYEGQEF